MAIGEITSQEKIDILKEIIEETRTIIQEQPSVERAAHSILVLIAVELRYIRRMLEEAPGPGP